jgi:hypothetical protein
MPTVPPYTPVIEPNLLAKNALPTAHLNGPGPIAFNAGDLPTYDTKRTEILDYIRLRLGDGMVDVELDLDHYHLAIDQGLQRYRQRTHSSVEESYAFLNLMPEVQEYILPKEITNVRQIFRRGIGSVTGTTASQFEPFASGFLNTYMLVAGRVGGLLSYELFSQYQEQAMKMFGGHMNFTFDRVTKKLTLIRKMPGLSSGDPSETVMLWTYNQRPEVSIFNDPLAYPWIQDYAYALCKHMLGEAREKFATIAGPQGGTSLNGAALKSEANQDLQRLDDELKNYIDGSHPLTWVTG